jgi:hypothetical protein
MLPPSWFVCPSSPITDFYTLPPSNIYKYSPSDGTYHIVSIWSILSGCNCIIQKHVHTWSTTPTTALLKEKSLSFISRAWLKRGVHNCFSLVIAVCHFSTPYHTRFSAHSNVENIDLNNYFIATRNVPSSKKYNTSPLHPLSNKYIICILYYCNCINYSDKK